MLIILNAAQNFLSSLWTVDRRPAASMVASVRKITNLTNLSVTAAADVVCSESGTVKHETLRRDRCHLELYFWTLIKCQRRIGDERFVSEEETDIAAGLRKESTVCKVFQCFWPNLYLVFVIYVVLNVMATSIVRSLDKVIHNFPFLWLMFQ